MRTYGGAKQPREKKANGFFPNKSLPHELGKQTGRIDGYGQLLPEQKQKTSTLQEMPPPLRTICRYYFITQIWRNTP
jgi:hypothetical protein